MPHPSQKHLFSRLSVGFPSRVHNLDMQLCQHDARPGDGITSNAVPAASNRAAIYLAVSAHRQCRTVDRQFCYHLSVTQGAAKNIMTT
jgi:hypothetical protein